jgi:hypothetical protein
VTHGHPHISVEVQRNIFTVGRYKEKQIVCNYSINKVKKLKTYEGDYLRQSACFMSDIVDDNVDGVRLRL